MPSMPQIDSQMNIAAENEKNHDTSIKNGKTEEHKKVWNALGI